MSTDFTRIMDPERREHFVYRYFDADGRLIYVGCSMNPEKRRSEHRYTQPWGNDVARIRLSGPYNYKKARDLEREAIRTEDPLHNGQTPRNFKSRMDRQRAFDEIMRTAQANGEDVYEAMTLAGNAMRSEELA